MTRRHSYGSCTRTGTSTRGTPRRPSRICSGCPGRPSTTTASEGRPHDRRRTEPVDEAPVSPVSPEGPVRTPASAATPTLSDPDTPFAVVDVHKARRNVERLAARADRLGVGLRPHVKTAKSLDVAALLHEGDPPCPVTVSTLAEAEAFADGGYTDITYAVGIDPHKLPRVIALLRRGVTRRVLLDSAEQAESVAEASRRAGLPVP